LESQIDELVVEATKRKTVSKHGLREVESFRTVLSDMLSSLKVLFLLHLLCALFHFLIVFDNFALDL